MRGGFAFEEKRNIIGTWPQNNQKNTESNDQRVHEI